MPNTQVPPQTIPSKRERSPTPPLTLQPRTSGVKLVAPLPLPCRKTNPTYRKARKLWIREEIEALNVLGLSVRNQFLREDGLSLEWESPVPVCPHSLKPANLPLSPSPTPPTHVDEDVDMQTDLSPAQTTSRPEFGERVADSVPVELDVAQDRTRGNPLDAYLELQATELEDLAIEYLKKYAQVFDTNRVNLSHAYASNALFSYAVHEFSTISGTPCNPVATAFINSGSTIVNRFAPRKGSRNLLYARSTASGGCFSSGNLHSGPSEIVKALQSLGSQYKFCAHSPTELSWNVLAFRLDQSSKEHSREDRTTSVSAIGDVDQDGEDSRQKQHTLLVYLSSHGELTEDKGNGLGSGSGDRRLSFDQCFILQRPQRTDQTGRSEGAVGTGESIQYVKHSEIRKASLDEDESLTLVFVFISMLLLWFAILRTAFPESDPREGARVDFSVDTDEWPLVAINHQLTVRELSLAALPLAL